MVLQESLIHELNIFWTIGQGHLRNCLIQEWVFMEEKCRQTGSTFNSSIDMAKSSNIFCVLFLVG